MNMLHTKQSYKHSHLLVSQMIGVSQKIRCIKQYRRVLSHFRLSFAFSLHLYLTTKKVLLRDPLICFYNIYFQFYFHFHFHFHFPYVEHMSNICRTYVKQKRDNISATNRFVISLCCYVLKKCLFNVLGNISLFPRNVKVLSAHVTVSCKLTVNWTAKVKSADNSAWS